MRRLRHAATLATLLLITTPVIAGSVGFLDAERAVASVKEGQTKLREFEAWAEPERQRVEALWTKMNDLRQRLIKCTPSRLANLKGQFSVFVVAGAITSIKQTDLE